MQAEVEAETFKAARHYVVHLHMAGEIPASLDQLRKIIGDSVSCKRALEWTDYLIGRTLLPQSVDVAVEIEGLSSADDPIDRVTEIGARGK